MTDSILLEELREIAEKGPNGMSQENHNRMLFAALLGITEKQNEASDTLTRYIEQANERAETINERIRTTELAIQAQKEYHERHRPLIWYFRYKTERTLLIMVTVFVIMTAIYVSDLRQFFLSLAGLPTDILPPIK